MSSRTKTWISLWEALLEEAVEECLIARSSNRREYAAAGASIVLARTSWEAFANELIEQRGLSPSLMGASTYSKLDGVYGELCGAAQSWRGQKEWVNFLLANDIRNYIAHQKNIASAGETFAEDVLRNLRSAGVLGAGGAIGPFEPHLLTAHIAGWCCHSIAAAITALEDIPSRQFRSALNTKVKLSDILSKL